MLSVKTQNGDSVCFTRKKPGRISDTGVYGRPEVHIQFGEKVDSISFTYKSSHLKNKIKNIWINGNCFDFERQDSMGYVCVYSKTITIPLEKIVQMRILDTNLNLLGGIAVGAIVVVFFITSAIAFGY